MASGSQSMSNTLVIHEAYKWELVFVGYEAAHVSLKIIDPPVWLTRFFNCCQ
jgi:hypothetical protein